MFFGIIFIIFQRTNVLISFYMMCYLVSTFLFSNFLYCLVRVFIVRKQKAKQWMFQENFIILLRFPLILAHKYTKCVIFTIIPRLLHLCHLPIKSYLSTFYLLYHFSLHLTNLALDFLFSSETICLAPYLCSASCSSKSAYLS